MSRISILLAFTVWTSTSQLALADEAKVQVPAAERIVPYSAMPASSIASSGCLNGSSGADACCPTGSCDVCDESWSTRMSGGWARKSRSIRRWWYHTNQGKKGLQHPAYAPHDHPNFGYHPTCWRTFPQICNPCPPANASAPGYVPAPATGLRAVPRASRAIPASISIPSSQSQSHGRAWLPRSAR